MIEQLYMLCFALMKLLMPLSIIAFFCRLAYIFVSTYIKNSMKRYMIELKTENGWELAAIGTMDTAVELAWVNNCACRCTRCK